MLAGALVRGAPVPVADVGCGMDAESVAAKYEVSRAWVHRIGWSSGGGRPDRSRPGSKRNFAGA